MIRRGARDIRPTSLWYKLRGRSRVPTPERSGGCPRMTFVELNRDVQPPRRRHAGDDLGSSAAGPKLGRASFTPKLGYSPKSSAILSHLQTGWLMRYPWTCAVLLVVAASAAAQRATPTGPCNCKMTPEAAARDTNGTLGAYNDYHKSPTANKLLRAREQFIITATEQLSKQGLSKKTREFLLSEASRIARDDARFVVITDLVAKAASERGVLCKVMFCTTTPGAVINYQTIGERLRGEPAHSLPATTNCVTRLPIGSYYIWTSRDSQATSDTNREMAIINSAECVQLQERN
jgi:hypothetical protein